MLPKPRRWRNKLSQEGGLAPASDWEEVHLVSINRQATKTRQVRHEIKG
jgi:hypothetical protein